MEKTSENQIITEIPPSLIKKLQSFEPIYIRLAAKTKVPIEKHWREDAKKNDNPELQDHLKNNGNYGIVTGYGLVVVDIDPDGIDVLSGKFPQTFSVRTGRLGLHLYYLCNLEKKVVLENNGTHLGEVQTNGEYVVGPNSTHPNGRRYEIQQDLPLTQITKDELHKILKGFMVSDKVFEKIEDQTDRERREYPIDIEMSNLIDLSKFSFNGKEYWGENPFHGSATGSNTWINPEKNCWICFRHHSGGGPFQWLAIATKIISCGEELTPEKWLLTVEEAKKRGLISEKRHAEISNKINLKYAETREGIISHLEENYLFYTNEDDPNLALYIWNKNVWKPKAEAMILSELQKISKVDKPEINKVELIDYFKGLGIKNKLVERPPEKIPFLNGLFNIDTFQLESHTPNYFSVNIIPHNYSVDAKCPNWKSFLEEIHKKEDLEFIQEWWGYNLYTAYPKKALMILIGTTNNGKTIELDVMKEALGEENYTPITLQEVTYEEYYSSELHHQMANVCDELPSNKITNVEKINNICAGGIISARQIYGKPFKFHNYAKPSYATNEPPDITQNLDAFWGRLYMVECPYTFSLTPDTEKGEKQAIDKEQLESNLFPEIEGILNWMIEGLIRLRNNKWKFSYSKSVEEIKKYYRIKASPVVSWIEEVFEYTGNDEEGTYPEDALQSFTAWCKNNKIKVIPGRGSFFKKLNDEGIVPRQSRSFEKRIYLGYTLKVCTCSTVTRLSSSLQQKIDNIEIEGDNILRKRLENARYSATEDKEDYPLCVSCAKYASCEFKPKTECDSYDNMSPMQ